MELIKAKDYREMCKLAAEKMIKLVMEKPNAVLGLATGSTPLGTYGFLKQDYEQNGTSYQQVTTFNLDEYVGLDGSHPQSYRYFMNKNLFSGIDIQLDNTYVPSGQVENMEEECLNYESLLRTKGPIDLQLLGIGRNGHIGFNEPGTSFQTNTHVVELTESTREANKRFFDSIEEVPTHAITMGISSIMESNEILLLVSGESKAPIVRDLFEKEQTEEIPATVLKSHPNVTVIADEEALSLLTEKV
ncbi:glucosamine-6-phosphate deaminase [Risungbinella massiliensis]|uniref:glucosamine-6-phosphate deaminase n=1 Tax=Risungbinella massiliensis TaxID=1329796 RepID=UPI0005CB8B58|nr:glucosamine-6-phosphate deaminase [Risungbinella massiliensis]